MVWDVEVLFKALNAFLHPTFRRIYRKISQDHCDVSEGLLDVGVVLESIYNIYFNE